MGCGAEAAGSERGGGGAGEAGAIAEVVDAGCSIAGGYRGRIGAIRWGVDRGTLLDKHQFDRGFTFGKLG